MTKTILKKPIIPGLIITAIALTLTLSIIPAQAAPPEDLVFSWNPDDTSSDPDNLIVVNGKFTRQGLLFDSTSDVQGELAGNLKAKIKNESTTIVETTAGSSTITTTVEAHSQKASKLQGTITIDGDVFVVKFKPSSQATILTVVDEFSVPAGTQTTTLEKLTISGKLKMETADKTKSFEGFGVLREESSTTEAGGNSITFSTIILQAELIGDAGFFELNLSKMQRTVETTP